MEKFIELLNSFDIEHPNFPPTMIYNEGWMLRLVLEWFSKNLNVDHKINFHEDAKWFSEAQLPTPFGSRYRGDQLAESRTNADGVIGHFVVGSEGKTDFVLLQNATQFIVLEAKMFSRLSPGIKNAPNYDQVARTVACMAEALRRAGKSPGDAISLGFNLLAPESQLISKDFPEMDQDSIHRRVKERVDSYEGEKDDFYQEWFCPMMNLIEINKMSWEEVLEFIISKDPNNGVAFKEFFERCITFN